MSRCFSKLQAGLSIRLAPIPGPSLSGTGVSEISFAQITHALGLVPMNLQLPVGVDGHYAIGGVDSRGEVDERIAYAFEIEQVEDPFSQCMMRCPVAAPPG